MREDRQESLATHRQASVRFVMASLLFLGGAAAGAWRPAWAANLLQNPRFDGGLSGWQDQDDSLGTGGWESFDANGAPGSGSAVVTNLDPEVGITLSRVYQCRPVNGGADYTAAAETFIPQGQARTGVASLQLLWFDNPNCGFPALNFEPVEQTASLGSWIPLSGAVTAPPQAMSVLFSFWVEKTATGGSLKANFDNAFFGPAGGAACLGGETALCLTGSRFKVEATWRKPDGQTGAARAVPLTSDSGYFWFFNAANAELFVKVRDACLPPYDHFWVFAAGLTNVRVELKVTDTETGEVETYINPLNRPFQPIQDTDAFATCP